MFEDGEESRDFVYVSDVIQATAKALLVPINGCHVLNVGCGVRTSVNEVARLINEYYGSKSKITVTGRFREGDIRHGAADLIQVKNLLDYQPEWTFADGLERFLNWASESNPSTEGYERSLTELRSRGLLHEQN